MIYDSQPLLICEHCQDKILIIYIRTYNRNKIAHVKQPVRGLSVAVVTFINFFKERLLGWYYDDFLLSTVCFGNTGVLWHSSFFAHKFLSKQ